MHFRCVVTRFLTTLLLLLLVAAMVAAALRPVCVRMSGAEVKQMRPRFDDRDDRDLFIFKVYQRHDGAPYQCKAWISRQLLL
jgi:hypothetical protein